MPTHTNFDDQLGRELYELTQEPSGATPATIRGKPHLMSLSYIRAEAPRLDDGEAQEEALAVTVRGFIEQATYALDEDISEREDKDADKGAAARCLLGLHPGTGSMNRADRRKRAAEYLVKHVRTITKRRTEREGESHEMRLMSHLAAQLQEREVDFLRGQSGDSGNAGAACDPHWLASVHNAWDTARKLSANLKLCCGFHRPEPGEDHQSRRDYASLELFGKFWQYVEIPAKDSTWFVKNGEPKKGRASLVPEIRLAAMFGRGLTTILFVSSPFERETIERLSTGVDVAPNPDPIPIVRELITPWRAWLESCPCPEATPDPKSCEVHWFHSSLEQYVKELLKCWDDLRDPHHTPAHFRNDPSPAKILEKHGLRIPVIDKDAGIMYNM